MLRKLRKILGQQKKYTLRQQCNSFSEYEASRHFLDLSYSKAFIKTTSFAFSTSFNSRNLGEVQAVPYLFFPITWATGSFTIDLLFQTVLHTSNIKFAFKSRTCTDAHCTPTPYNPPPPFSQLTHTPSWILMFQLSHIPKITLSCRDFCETFETRKKPFPQAGSDEVQLKLGSDNYF